MRSTAIISVLALGFVMICRCEESCGNIDKAILAIDNISTGFEGFKWAVFDRFIEEELNGNTNHLVEAAKAIATNSAANITCASGIISRYGNECDIPYLYQLARDERADFSVLIQLERRDSISTNYLSVLRQYLASTNIDAKSSARVCRRLVKRASSVVGNSEFSEEARSIAVDYAKRDNKNVMWLDECFCQSVPSYQYSTNRLAVLRSVLSLGVNEYQIGFVTNTIHELEMMLEQN